MTSAGIREQRAESREQVSAIRPQLGIVERRRPVIAPSVCCVERCGKPATVGAFCPRRCWEEYQAISAYWERELQRRLDPLAQARSRRRRRFTGYCCFTLVCEVLIGWALDAPFDLFQIGLALCWAPMIAGLGVALDEREARRSGVSR